MIWWRLGWSVIAVAVWLAQLVLFARANRDAMLCRLSRGYGGAVPPLDDPAQIGHALLTAQRPFDMILSAVLLVIVLVFLWRVPRPDTLAFCWIALALVAAMLWRAWPAPFDPATCKIWPYQKSMGIYGWWIAGVLYLRRWWLSRHAPEALND